MGKVVNFASVQVPKPGTRGFVRVVARGCGGTRDYFGEFDCSHQYGWNCDDCPIVRSRESEKSEYAALVLATFDSLTHADNRARAEKRAEIERKARNQF